MTRKVIRYFSSFLASILLCTGAAQAANHFYTFGFVPQQSAKVLVEKWGPILKRLSELSGHKLVFRTAPKIPIFEERLAAGEYDFAYMNSVHYTVFASDPGYRAFAKQKGKQIKGILVSRKDTPLTGLNDLKGKTLAFPAPAAFAASVLPRTYLSLNDIAITPKYVGSHDSVYRSVAMGLYPAGGGIQRTFGTVDAEIKDQLKVLWTTVGYTSHAFAAHPKIPFGVVSAVQSALAEMFNDLADKELLLAVGFKQGAERAHDGNWQDVRELGITELPK